MLGRSRAVCNQGILASLGLMTVQAGKSAVNISISMSVMSIALRADTLTADTHNPSDKEKKSELSATRAIRPNSPTVRPPIKSGTPKIGSTAITQ